CTASSGPAPVIVASSGEKGRHVSVVVGRIYYSASAMIFVPAPRELLLLGELTCFTQCDVPDHNCSIYENGTWRQPSGRTSPRCSQRNLTIGGPSAVG